MDGERTRHYRTQAQGYDFIQSENARLKRIIQAKGYTTKKLKNKHSSINQKNNLPMIKKMGHSINTLRGAVVTDRPTRNFVVMS